MRTPFSIIPYVGASGICWTQSTIPLVRARTLSITTQCRFGGQIDADAVVYVFYSPDGDNWDTIALTSWAIAFTVSTVKQVTKVINVPEHGYIRVKIQNTSSADVITLVKFWYTIQSWDAFDATINEIRAMREEERQRYEETGQKV